MHDASIDKLEQVECLCSEIPPPTPHLETLQETLHATHLLKLLDKMNKYEMDPTRTVGAREQTRDAGRTDGWKDRWMEGRTDRRSETNIPPNQCWKFPQARRPEADNFRGGPETFCWFFFNFMIIIWDSRHEDLQLFLTEFQTLPPTTSLCV